MLRHVSFSLFALFCASVGRLDGQTCFRGQPLPNCKVFFITEVGYTHKLTAGRPEGSFGSDDAVHYVGGELGLMVNRGRFALGGTGFFGGLGGTGDLGGALRGGVKGRVRRWLDDSAALDVGAGPMITGENELGFSSHLALSIEDRILMLTQFEVVGGESDVYFGMRLGSKPAVWASLAAGALLGVGALALSGG